MIVGNHRIDIDREQFSLTKLDAIAIPDRWKQDIDAPVQPLPHGLARGRIGPLRSAERLGQVLNNGRRLEMHALAVNENRNLAPTGQRQKLWRLVHSLL